MKRGPDDLLIAALQSRDELTELRRDLPEAGVLLKRNLRELETSEISPPYLRHVAEEIWRRLFARPMSVTELHQYLSVSELKVYQAVRELLNSGHLAFADSMIAEKVA